MTTTLNAPTTTPLKSKPRIVGKAAIYSRVSTLDQERGASMLTQKTDDNRYAQKEGLLVTHDFSDVQSGLKSDRAHYQEMLRAAKAGEFDHIIVWKIDRFGRDRIESGQQLRDLEDIGVRVHSATEPNDSPLLRNILMDFAEEESRLTSLRVSAGKRTRAQEGRRTSKPPFGYSNVAHAQGGRTLEPNEDAPIVAEVFHRYDGGRYSLADLRDYISEVGCSPNRPRTRAGVHHLLKNPTYAGIIRHGFWARSKIHRKSKDERNGEIFEADGCHKPLIDKETFRKVQLRLESNRPRANGRRHSSFLFTGLTWCGCGYRYSGKSTGSKTIVYYCVRKNDAGDCDSRSVSENRIKEVVLHPIGRLLAQLVQEDLRAAVRAELVSQQEASRYSVHQVQESLNENLKRLESRLSRLEDGYFDGDISRDRYLTRRDEILVQLADVKATLAAQPNPATVDLDQLFAIAESITLETLDGQAWREIIEAMVDRIVIEGPAAKAGGRHSPATIKVAWKPEYEALIAMAGKRTE